MGQYYQPQARLALNMALVAYLMLQQAGVLIHYYLFCHLLRARKAMNNALRGSLFENIQSIAVCLSVMNYDGEGICFGEGKLCVKETPLRFSVRKVIIIIKTDFAESLDLAFRKQRDDSVKRRIYLSRRAAFMRMNSCWGCLRPPFSYFCASAID